MELNLLPADIDKFIKEAILKSALGNNLQRVIDEAMKNALHSYDNPIKTLVGQTIKEIIGEHLSKQENRKFIEDAIVNIITPKTIKDILEYGIEKLKDDVTRSNYS